jgi:hypothetical protein
MKVCDKVWKLFLGAAPRRCYKTRWLSFNLIQIKSIASGKL